MKLYHYIHCPFCIRVRMALGYLNLNYETIVLSYDDEETPISLVGKKSLPILEIDGRNIMESLDIIELVDKEDVLRLKALKGTQEFKDTMDLVSDFSKDVYNLVMPHWCYSKEFNDAARKYFIDKKEQSRGDFNQLAKNQNLYLKSLRPKLDNVEKLLEKLYPFEALNIKEVLIASHLWGLYMLPEFQFSERLDYLLKKIGERTKFNYLEDFWR